MRAPNDWRLQGQERVLKGRTLHFSRYTTPRADWDHDHCAFCSTKFMVAVPPGDVSVGYTTDDRYYWICSACYEDFADLFEWRLAPSDIAHGGSDA
jgi:hypothetical protein